MASAPCAKSSGLLMQIRQNGGEVSHVWGMKLWLSAAGLAALLLLQMGMKFVAVAQFFQHRDAIASALCVEREVPGSCCKGSCQVARMTLLLDGGGTAAPAEPVPSEGPLPVRTAEHPWARMDRWAVGGMGRARWMRQLRALLDGNQRIPLTM